MKPKRTEPLTANEMAIKCWLERRVAEELALDLAYSKVYGVIANVAREHNAKAEAFKEMLDWWFT